MIFTETPLKGAFLIDPESQTDVRGLFARTYCKREFEAHGLQFEIVQSNLSLNLKAGTLRGLHFQREPVAEPKLIRCVRGKLYCVIIDLRASSIRYGEHLAIELTAGTHRALFIPKSFASGFQTLADETIVEYHMGEFYAPELAAGYRYDDPAFSIVWPLPIRVISKQDLSWPAFRA